MTGIELNMEVQEMPPDGSKCFECGEIITGKMFQYFLFEGTNLKPTPTKFKFCEPCYIKAGE